MVNKLNLAATLLALALSGRLTLEENGEFTRFSCKASCRRHLSTRTTASDWAA